MTLTTALLYTRVSSDEQAREGLSLEAQLAECQQYAVRHGWLLGMSYTDVMSGSRDDRPQYQQLLADARQLRSQRIDVAIVVAALDRLGRRLIERVRSREEFLSLGIAVHSVREGGEVSDLVANILGAVAQEEIRRLSERIKASNAHLVSTGWWANSHAPIGYVSRPATPEEKAQGAPKIVLEVDEPRAKLVRTIFSRVANGQSIRSVARWVQSLTAEERGGRQLNYVNVHTILKRPLYVARPTHGDADVLARPVGRWPRIVSDELWAATFENLEEHRHRPHQASGAYLLTGLIHCPKCGGRACGSLLSDPPTKRQTYRCLNMTTCVWVAPVHTIDAFVSAQVAQLLEPLADPAWLSWLAPAWDEIRRPGELVAARSNRIALLSREIERARERLTEAALRLVDGALDQGGYTLLRARVLGDLERAQGELGRLETAPEPAMLPPISELIVEAAGWREALASGDTVVRREVLAPFITALVPFRIAYGKYEATITWTALGEALGLLAGMHRSQLSMAR